MFLGILIAACWQHVGFCELWPKESITYLSSVALRTVALKPNREQSDTDWETARGQLDTGRILDGGDLQGPQ